MLATKIGVALSTVACLACQTNGVSPLDNGEPLAYDGILEEMDSLPDCNEETQGSLFWVRTQKSGFECGTDKQWNKRGTVEPEEVEFKPQSALETQSSIKRL